ncbi:MAG: hypothetical protein OXD33_00115 [Rhodobacteraceae bacterium]|nr:hypothetical protein [Paracoccaceae bacterium]
MCQISAEVAEWFVSACGAAVQTQHALARGFCEMTGLTQIGRVLTHHRFLICPGVRVKRLVSSVLRQAAGRELKIVAIADGTQDNWTCLESLTPDIRVVDVWHACQYLKAAADAAYGTESAKSTTWFNTYKVILTDDPQGVARAFSLSVPGSNQDALTASGPN